MKRPEITKQLSELLEKHIDPHNDPRVYWAKEVTFDYATSNTVRVDYMLFKPINNSISGIEKEISLAMRLNPPSMIFTRKMDTTSLAIRTTMSCQRVCLRM